MIRASLFLSLSLCRFESNRVLCISNVVTQSNSLSSESSKWARRLFFISSVLCCMLLAIFAPNVGVFIIRSEFKSNNIILPLKESSQCWSVCKSYFVGFFVCVLQRATHTFFFWCGRSTELCWIDEATEKKTCCFSIICPCVGHIKFVGNTQDNGRSLLMCQISY